MVTAQRQAHRAAAERVRLAHLVSHPIQYYAPLYRAIAARPEVDLTVYFFSDVSLSAYFDTEFNQPVTWDIDLIGGYRHRILPGAHGRPIRAGLAQRPHVGILREVLSGCYDALWLNGYNHISLALAGALGRVRGLRVLLREEQTLLESRPFYKRVAKQTALRAFFSMVDGLYIGEANRQYFQYFGVPAERLFRVPYCVDNAYFGRRARDLAPMREALRRQIGVTDDAPVILFAGKLIEKKAPRDLLEAFRVIRPRHSSWLVFMGEGPLRAALESEVERSHIPNVRFLGFVNQAGLADVYSASDLFVLPSRFHETWGLVVNEAMNFRLPVVVSDHVGCAADLVRPGWNGFVTPVGNITALADAIATLVGDPDLRTQFGEHSHRLVQEYSIDSAADGLIGALRAR
jgi:glycosyltransferase involved in cell wall biosynthesis